MFKFIFLFLITYAHHCFKPYDPTLSNDLTTKVQNVELTEHIRNITMCSDIIMDSNTTVYYLLNDTEIIKKLKVNDTTVSSWLEFLNYGPTMCSNPPTSTIAIACKAYAGASVFGSSIKHALYPYASSPQYEDSAGVIRNSSFINSLFYFRNSSTTTTSDVGFSDMFPNTYAASTYLSHTLSDSSIYHIYTNFNHSEHHDLKFAYHKFINHITTPIRHAKALYNYGIIGLLFSKFADVTMDNIGTVAKRVSDMKEEYLFPHSSQSQYNETHKSIHHYLTHFNNRERKWNNLQDPNNIIYLYNPIDIVNFVGSIISWTFHLNGVYNESGCLYKGSPYFLYQNVICKKPIFKGLQSVNIFPAGFDMVNHGCLAYYNPITYVKGLFYVGAWVVELGTYLDVHTGYQPLLSWMVYDFQGTRVLPPNLIPCYFVITFVPLLLISILAVSCFCCCLSFRIIEKSQRAIFKNSDPQTAELPNITQNAKPLVYGFEDDANLLKKSVSNVASAGGNLKLKLK